MRFSLATLLIHIAVICIGLASIKAGYAPFIIAVLWGAIILITPQMWVFVYQTITDPVDHSRYERWKWTVVFFILASLSTIITLIGFELFYLEATVWLNNAM